MVGKNFTMYQGIPVYPTEIKSLLYLLYWSFVNKLCSTLAVCRNLLQRWMNKMRKKGDCGCVNKPWSCLLPKQGARYLANVKYLPEALTRWRCFKIVQHSRYRDPRALYIHDTEGDCWQVSSRAWSPDILWQRIAWGYSRGNRNILSQLGTVHVGCRP